MLLPAGTNGDAADLAAHLTDKELDMPVAQYLQAQCDRRASQLREHMDSNIAAFEAEATKARAALREVATTVGRNADDVEGDVVQLPCGTESNVDAFALLGIRGRHTGRIVKIQPTDALSTWSIGRTESNVICLAGDDEVSSNHAKISFVAKSMQFKLMDVGSTNGTFASSTLVTAAKLKKRTNHVLKVDHLVTIGSTTFKWYAREGVAGNMYMRGQLRTSFYGHPLGVPLPPTRAPVRLR